MDSPGPGWDDEDAMIAEDMDFEEEEPSYDFDEAMLAEAELQEDAPMPSTTGGDTRPPAVAVATATAGAPEPMDDNAFSSDDDADHASVREEYQRKRPNPDSHFKFDR